MGVFGARQCDQALAQATVGGNELTVARPPVMEQAALTLADVVSGPGVRRYGSLGFSGIGCPRCGKSARTISGLLLISQITMINI